MKRCVDTFLFFTDLILSTPIYRYTNTSAQSTVVQQPGVPPGDVVFVLKCKPHTSFERSGNDLLTTVHITLSEALLGFSRILLTHLDGRGVHVSSPKGKIIKPGDSIVLRGEGMPHRGNPDQKGQLYVILEVDMPEEGWLASVDQKACIFHPHSILSTSSCRTVTEQLLQCNIPTGPRSASPAKARGDGPETGGGRRSAV